MINTFFKLVFMAIGAVLVFALGLWVLALLAGVGALFGLAYLLNAKFTVSENGVKVGYYKRSTSFVRTE